jgi:predicted permease
MLADLRYAIRMLLKNPLFTLVALATLALGIGANTAIFSVVDAILLRPLPFLDPDRIVMIWGNYSDDTKPTRNVHSFPDFVDLRDQSQSFSGMAAYTRTAGTLSLAGDAQYLEGNAITPEVFDVLGVTPFLGRGFTQEDAKDQGELVIVLSHPFWKRAFGGDPGVIGTQVTLSARSYRVIGVMPAGWKFPIEDAHIDYLVPLQYLVPSALVNRGSHFLSIVGRLKSGVTQLQAQTELSAIAGRLSKRYPDTNMNFVSVHLVTLHADAIGAVRAGLLILLGAVVLVLLIACANVANLLLARAASRSREIAIRAALGAGRTRIIRQLLCESALLAFLGGFAGLILASWCIDLIGAAGPQGLPHIGQIKMNLQVCAFTFVIATGSTVLFGLIPALQISKLSVTESLQQGSKGSTGGLQTNKLRSLLVVSQVSLSLLLLLGAGLLIKSFFNLQAINPGFDPERLMTMELTLPRARYPEEVQQVRTYDAIMEKIAAIHGIESTGGANPLPLGGNSSNRSFMVSGAAPQPLGNHPSAGFLIIKPDYFQTMRIPILQGRAFNKGDIKESPLVIVVNDSFARKHFADRKPIGQQVMVDLPDGKISNCEIIGVVGDSRHDSLASAAEPEMYVPLAQNPSRTLSVTMRVISTGLLGLQAEVKRAVHEIDRELFVPTIEPMQTFLSNQLARPRFNMMLLALFAVVAMVLAAIGIYGVIAYNVTQRTREIGIRLALGAQRADMLQMILRQSLILVTIGLAIGFLVSLVATRVLASLLYGVTVTDISTYAAVMLLLGGAALLASYLPARRAMKVDPMVALRYE